MRRPIKQVQQVAAPGRVQHPLTGLNRREPQVERAEAEVLIDAGAEQLFLGVLEDHADLAAQIEQTSRRS